MADDRVYRHTGTRAAFLVIVRRVRNAMGLPKCNCPTHGGTGGLWAPCTCGPSGVGAEADRGCPHVTLRPTRVVRHPVTPGVFGLVVDDAVFARLTAGEKTTVEPFDAGWDGAPDEDDT